MKVLLGICFIVLVLRSTPTLSQDRSTIDSLRRSLSHCLPAEQARLLNELGWEYRLSHPDSTLRYCRRAIELGTQQESWREVAQALNFIGLAHTYKGNATEALRWHQQALELATQHADSSQLAHAYNNLGRLYFNQGDAIKSYRYFYKALSIFERVGNTRGAGYVYQSLGHLYRRQQNTDKSLEMFRQAQQIREGLADRRGVISTLQEIAHLLEKKGNQQAAYATFLQARAISKELNDRISLAEIDLGIAEMSLTQAKYSEAEKYCRQALVTIGLSQNEPLYASIYLVLAKIHFARRQLRQAKLYLEKVIASSRETGNLKVQTESYDYLSRIYENQQDYQRSLQAHRQYLALKDSLYNADMARALERQEGQLALEKKENEYALLQANQARDHLIMQQQKSWDIAKSITIALITVLLGTLLFSYFRIRKKNDLLVTRKEQIEDQHRKIQKQNTELNQKNRRLAQLAQEKDALMNMVAHDLRAPLNRLMSIADLAMIPGIEANEREKFLQMIKDVSSDGVTLAEDLLDSNQTLAADQVQRKTVRLKLLFDQLLIAYRTRAREKSVELRVAVSPLLQVQTDEKYLIRILDNLLSNAIKFSPPHRAVYLGAYSDEKGNVKLSVRDEGPGFSEEDKQQLFQQFTRLSARPTRGESSHGLGLSIVKKLVSHLAATIELVSEQKKGSEFIITFPAC